MSLATLDRSGPAQSSGIRALSVARLRLSQFRNYASLDLRLGAEPVVLSGDNGAGKTNLLEALSLLTPGRGLRGARLPELGRDGGGPFTVEAAVEGRLGRSEIVTRVDGARRAVVVDDRPLRSQDELGGVFAAVWLVPSMDRLFLEGPAGRRRFLDRLVLGLFPDHARHVAAYERALRERSHLLREGGRDAAWLIALERRMVEAGVAVAAARARLVRDLDAALASAKLPFPHASLRIAGEVEGWLDDAPAVDVEERFAAALAAGRDGDGQSGGASTGPHRTDLIATDAWSGEPAERASTGRQKAMLASIVVAQARLRLQRVGELPVLLLDEVTAHLDWRRRRELLEVVMWLGAQAWMTGTEPDLFRVLRGQARFLTVSNGTLSHHD